MMTTTPTCENSHRFFLKSFVWLALMGFIVWQATVISNSQQRIKDANDRLFRIVHGSPIATVMCDEVGKIVEYNRAAEEMFGWNREEMLGKSVDLLIAPEERAGHREALIKAVASLRVVDEDWRITRTGLKGNALDRNGKEFPIVFATRGIRFGGRIEFLATIRRDQPVPKLEAGPLEFPKKAT